MNRNIMIVSGAVVVMLVAVVVAVAVRNGGTSRQPKPPIANAPIQTGEEGALEGVTVKTTIKEGDCGDYRCDGEETHSNCPVDCDVVSRPTIVGKATSAVLKWKSDMPTMTEVYFENEGQQGAMAANVMEPNTDHEVTIGSLEKGTVYNLVMISKDENGNEVMVRHIEFLTDMED